jgi:hypothetical protein
MISLSLVLSGGGAARHDLPVQQLDPTPGNPDAPSCARLWNLFDTDNLSRSEADVACQIFKLSRPLITAGTVRSAR